jgi:hypothetical protein
MPLFAGVLPEHLMHTPWFAMLSTFVAINTLLYLTLAIIKVLPKAYLSDWIDQRNRRAESRSILPMSRAGAVDDALVLVPDIEAVCHGAAPDRQGGLDLQGRTPPAARS